MPTDSRRLPLTERRDIRDRLADFVARHYPFRTRMEKDIGAAHSTVAGWFHTNPSTPDSVSLVRLAQRKNLDLNWLLLGEGTELRGVPATGGVWVQLRETLVAELISHGVPVADARAVVPDSTMLFHMNLLNAFEAWLESPRYHKATKGGASPATRRKPRSVADLIAAELRRQKLDQRKALAVPAHESDSQAPK